MFRLERFESVLLKGWGNVVIQSSKAIIKK